SGTVSFSKDAGDSGAFSPAASCTLPASGANECRSAERRAADGDGTHSITATYGGDSAHTGDNQSKDVTVNKRASAVTLTCTPSTVVVNQGSSCTAAVADASAAGTTIRPSGTVSFSKDAGDSGAFSPAASCTLPASGANEC